MIDYAPGFKLEKQIDEYIKTQKLWRIKLRRKNFGGNIFGRSLHISAENLSDRFHNVGKNFRLKKCDRFGKRAVFKG